MIQAPIKKVPYVTICIKCGYLMALCRREVDRKIGDITHCLTDAIPVRSTVYILHLKTHLGEEYEKSTISSVKRFDISQ